MSHTLVSDCVTHPFNGPLSGTTRVSRYQKGKTNLDFSEARDSEWQWHQLNHMQVCTSLQTDNHTSTPPLIFYRPDALPAAQPTASKHWRHKVSDCVKWIKSRGRLTVWSSMDVITAVVALTVLNISMSLDPPPVMPLICDAISAGWQITRCNPTWHASSRSSKAGCKLLYSVYFTLLTLNVFWERRLTAFGLRLLICDRHKSTVYKHYRYDPT